MSSSLYSGSSSTQPKTDKLNHYDLIACNAFVECRSRSTIRVRWTYKRLTAHTCQYSRVTRASILPIYIIKKKMHKILPCWNFWMLLCLNSSISCSRLDSGSSTNTRPLLRSWYDASAAAKFIMAGGSAAGGIKQIISNQLNGKKVCRVCNYIVVVTNHAERCHSSKQQQYVSKEKLTAVIKKNHKCIMRLWNR